MVVSSVILTPSRPLFENLLQVRKLKLTLVVKGCELQLRCCSKILEVGLPLDFGTGKNIAKTLHFTIFCWRNFTSKLRKLRKLRSQATELEQFAILSALAQKR